MSEQIDAWLTYLLTLTYLQAHVSEQIDAWRATLGDEQLVPLWHGEPYARKVGTDMHMPTYMHTCTYAHMHR